MKPANSVESFEQLLLNLEEMFRRYDGMAENQMPEDIRCAILVACCPKDLKEYLDMSSEDFVYSDLRVKANTWIERKRDQQPKNLQQLESKNHQGPTPMEIGAAQWGPEDWEDHASQDSQDWGGYPDASHQCCRWHENQLSEEMSFVHQGGKSKGKGKGKDGGKGKGKTAAKAKARTAGKAKARTAARGLVPIKGIVTWCGMWGHTAKFCKQKDTYMEEQRRLWSQSASAVEQEPWAIDSSEHTQEGLAALENSALHTWRELGGFELGCLLKQNRFAAIAETDGEDDDEQCVRQYQVACTQHESHMKTRDREILSVDRVKHLDLTIDSGAAEHVIGPKIVPHVPVQTSEGSKKGVHYVAANGTKMVNQGEQVVSATTGSGQRCRFKLQVTDVHRPLMSVSRLCDAGHRVVFEANSGYIQSVATGEKVQFRRDNNVYRLGVSVPTGDFPWQGQQHL